MLPADVVNPRVSKAFKAFVNRSRAPCPLDDAWYTVTRSSELNPLKRCGEDLNRRPHIMVYSLGWLWVGTC